MSLCNYATKFNVRNSQVRMCVILKLTKEMILNLAYGDKSASIIDLLNQKWVLQFEILKPQHLLL